MGVSTNPWNLPDHGGATASWRSYESVDDIVGSVLERGLLDRVFRDRDAVSRSVAGVMDEALPVVELRHGIDDVVMDLSQGAEAVVVVDGSKPVGVLSRADLLEFLVHQPS